MNQKYYQVIETYYDEDAAGFDRRYWKNDVLQRIRQDFREKVKRFPFSNMLELGCGTGLDLVHFAQTHPDIQIHGVDISHEMCRISRQKIEQHGLKNVNVEKGSVEDIEKLFPGRQFDMVYVFFGALNTVENLELAANHLYHTTKPGGFLVLSFVNKHYQMGVFIEILKLRFKAAFSRFKPEWGGYSPSKYLPSKCFDIGEIKRAFRNFNLIETHGYCILHPAWYYHGLNQMLGRKKLILWRIDRFLNKTPLWKFGEYSLFVFQKPNHMG